MKIQNILLQKLVVAMTVISVQVNAAEVNHNYGIKDRYVTKKMREKPNKFRPYSAEYKGKLKPAHNIQKVISGKTIVFAQPWVNLKSYQIRTTPILFNDRNQSTSELWKDRPWQVAGNRLCIDVARKNRCFQALSDDQNHAFLLDEDTKLLTKVQEIQEGDTHHVYQAYAARQAANAKMNAMYGAMIGGLFALLTSGGGSVGSSYQEDENMQNLKMRSLDRDRRVQEAQNRAMQRSMNSGFGSGAYK